MQKPPVGTKIRFTGIEMLGDDHPINVKNIGKIGVVTPVPLEFTGRRAGAMYLDTRFDEWTKEDTDEIVSQEFLLCEGEWEVVE